MGGVLSPISYEFKVTIDYCEVENFRVDLVPGKLPYTIGDSD